jgi:hypothetical protein
MPRRRQPYTIEAILARADAYRAQTGSWPHAGARPVAGGTHPGWHAIDAALRKGRDGLPAGSSLPRLLAEYRGAHPRSLRCRLDEACVHAWAAAHFQRTGKWPTCESGPVVEAPGETWAAVNRALERGSRGLPGGTTLARLLDGRCGKRDAGSRPLLSAEQIGDWGEAQYRRTGRWPTRSSGEVLKAPGENWHALDAALREGRRGLPGGTTLYLLLRWRANCLIYQRT